MGQRSSKSHQNRLWLLSASYFIHLLSIVIGGYLIFLMATTPFFIRQQMQVLPESNLQSVDSLPLLKDINAYRSILEQKPLFGIKTKEMPAPVRSACDEFQQKYILSGIVTGGQNEALFSSKVGNKTTFVQAGESIGGVVVEAIQLQTVVISCSGKQVEILMEGA